MRSKSFAVVNPANIFFLEKPMATSSADCEQMIPRSVTPVSCSARALCRMGFTKSANRRLKQWINSQLRWILWLSAFVTTYGLTPSEEGLQDQRIIEAIYESARTGTSVSLPAPQETTRGPEPLYT
jgi:hypothetical protein